MALSGRSPTIPLSVRLNQPGSTRWARCLLALPPNPPPRRNPCRAGPLRPETTRGQLPTALDRGRSEFCCYFKSRVVGVSPPG